MTNTKLVEKAIKYAEKHGLMLVGGWANLKEKETVSETGKKKIGGKAKGKMYEKDPRFMPGWKEVITADNWQEILRAGHQKDGKTYDYNLFAVITGKISGITGVDFDSKAEYIELVKKYPKLKDCLTEETKKGYHMYVKYYEDIETSGRDKIAGYPELEIKNEGTQLICYPTQYKTREGEVIYEYGKGEGSLKSCKTFLSEMSAIQIKKGTKNDKPNNAIISEKKKTQSVNNQEHEMIYEHIKNVLNHDSSRETWRDLCFIHKRIIGERYFDKFDEICSQYPGYDATENETEYMANDIERYGYTLPELLKKSELANIDEYERIVNYFESDFTYKKFHSIKPNFVESKNIIPIKELKQKIKDLRNIIIELEDELLEIDSSKKEKSELKNKITKNKLLEKEYKDELKILEKEYKNENKELFEQEYQLKKEYFEKFHFKLENPMRYVKIKYIHDIVMYQTSEFKGLYANLFMNIGKDEDDKIMFIDKWMKDEEMRTHDAITFAPPPIKYYGRAYNRYKGLKIDTEFLPKLRTQKEIENGINIIENHMKSLVGNNDEYYQYLYKVLADKVKNPGKLQKICIIFKSIQGVGKNLFEEAYGRMLFGEQYTEQTSNMNNICGEFNGIVDGKLILIIDELASMDGYKHIERFKDVITAMKLAVQKKFAETKGMDNYMLTFVNSNNDNPLKLTPDDRRFVVFDCSPENAIYKKVHHDNSYFEAVADAMYDLDIMHAWKEKMINMDLTGFDASKDRPITDAHMLMAETNIPLEHRWLLDYVQERWTDYVDNRDENIFTETSHVLYKKFDEYIKEFGYTKYDTNITAFSRKLNKLSDNIIKSCKPTIHGKQVRAFQINKVAFIEHMKEQYPSLWKDEQP